MGVQPIIGCDLWLSNERNRDAAYRATVLCRDRAGYLGLCELLTPTNGALMAILIAAGVPYQRWLRFALPVVAALFVLGLAALATGIAVSLA